MASPIIRRTRDTYNLSEKIKHKLNQTIGVSSRGAAIACVAMAGVAYQVALVRLLSVVLWYHFAFLVVSLAVLGFGLSGVLLVLRPELTRNDGFEARTAHIAQDIATPICLLNDQLCVLA